MQRSWICTLCVCVLLCATLVLRETHAVRIIIVGGGKSVTTIDGNSTSRVFDVQGSNAALELYDLTVQNGYQNFGNANGETFVGGAIRLVDAQELIVDNCTLQNNLVQSATGPPVFGYTAHGGGAVGVVSTLSANTSTSVSILDAWFYDNTATTVTTSAGERMSAYGGALFFSGRLGNNMAVNIQRSGFMRSKVMSASGGAIFSVGDVSMLVVDTLFEQNTATRFGDSSPNRIATGGAIATGLYSSGITGNAFLNSLTVQNSVFRNNSADYQGGAIVSDVFGGFGCNIGPASMSVAVSGSTFEDNTVQDMFSFSSVRIGGGAVAANCAINTVTFDATTFVRNTADNAPGSPVINDVGGGALLILKEVSVSVVECTFEQNYAPHDGGAIAARESSSISLERCTVHNNSVDTVTTASHFGGGLLCSETTVCAASRTTFSSNVARGGGAMHVVSSSVLPASASLYQCTLYDNVATADTGGAIMISSISNLTTIVNVTACTVYQNTAGIGTGTTGVGGIAGANTSPPSAGSLVVFHNTIIANNIGTHVSQSHDITMPNLAQFLSLGFNLVRDQTGNVAAVLLGSDLAAGLDPLLGAFQNNGGVTNTLLPMAPLSPAIDAGDNTLDAMLMMLDQRFTGFDRLSGSDVDIGAVEVQAFITCNSDNKCTSLTDQCNMGLCNMTSGFCYAAPINEGLACDDGLACNVGEVCQSGSCTGGVAIVCPDIDQCNFGVCVEPSGCISSTPKPDGTTCDDSVLDDVCQSGDECVSGACTPALLPNTTECRAVADVCDVAEFCTGLSVACPNDIFEPPTTVCRVSAGVCDIQETCTGSAAACPLDEFVSNTTECRASAGICDTAELCTGSSADCPLDVFEPNTTECRASAGQCDVAEMCLGTSAFCPLDVPATLGTPCDDGLYCTVGDQCNGFSCDSVSLRDCSDAVMCTTDTCNEITDICEHVANDTFCNDGAFCNGPEHCNVTTDCQMGIPIDCSDGVMCTVDSCDEGTDMCVSVANDTLCSDNDVCNGIETCDAMAGCLPGTPLVCTPRGPCETVSCDPILGCVYTPLVSGTVCNPSAGDCDPAEMCDGIDFTCPVDTLSANGTLCRAPAGVCDVEEFCDGVSVSCPTDEFELATTVCRPSIGPCDVQDTCSGSGPLCPLDMVQPINTLCRAAVDACDVAEVCDGVSNTCPVDMLASDGTACDDFIPCTANDTCTSGMCMGTPVNALCDDANPCTEDVCNKTLGMCTNDPGNAGAICAVAPDVCVVDAVCTGVSSICPGVSFLPSGTPCNGSFPIVECGTFKCDGANAMCMFVSNDTNCDALEECADLFCDTDSTCQVASLFSSGTVCRASVGVCDAEEQCDGISSTCPVDQYANSTVVCRPSAGVCDMADTCSGFGPLCPSDVVFPSSTECRPPADICDIAENCDGINVDCPVDMFEPASTVCRVATDQCDAEETCTGASAFCPVDSALPNGTPCNDTLYCTLGETCQSGVCTMGIARDCSDGVTCTTDVCNEITDMCENTANDTFCNDGAFCNGPEYCNVTTDCQPGIPIDCSDGVVCTVDICDEGTDMCVSTANDTLCSDNDVCNGIETCDAMLGCQPGTPLVCVDNPATPCGMPMCDPILGCIEVAKPNTTVCRAATGPCDVEEYCDGVSLFCPTDLRQPNGTVCRAGDVCDPQEVCDGVSKMCPSDVVSPPTEVCRPAVGLCDVPETCTGSGPGCPMDVVESVGTVCRASSGLCDPEEVCDGISTACPADMLSPNTTVCRASTDVCDVEETCTGTSPTCPADVLQSNGTVCRAFTDVCDVEEVCDGVNASCPLDIFEPSTTECRPVAGPCDIVETCTGTSAACPTDMFMPSTAFCRVAADVCDMPEMCTGTNAACPVDGFLPNTILCRAMADVCDVAEFCTGTNISCPTDAFEPATTVCRAATDVCDVEETCSGSSAPCPIDAVFPNTTQCRSSAGVCDIAENCDGSNKACPADLFQPATLVCRASVDQCDAAENCTGSSADCPLDVSEPDGTPCDDTLYCMVNDQCVSGVCAGNATRDCSDSIMCTTDSCNEITDMCVNAPNDTFCNNGAFCDGPEFCSTTLDCQMGPPVNCSDGVTCTVDVCNEITDMCMSAPNDTLCDDGNVCNGIETCDGMLGCLPGTPLNCTTGNVCSMVSCHPTLGCQEVALPNTTLCRASNGLCDAAEFCDGISFTCPADMKQASGTVCRAGGVCDPAEVCDGASDACPADVYSPATEVCRASSGLCDPEETCSGAGPGCPTDVISSSGTVCRASVGICDVVEVCDGVNSTCPPDNLAPSGTLCRAAVGACDVAETCNGSSALCPTDAFAIAGTLCRASAGVCDPAEMCTGSNGMCPPNAFSPPSTVCRAAADVCDIEETCTGSSAACPVDTFEPPGTVCRSSAGVCDIEETCDGSNVACPTDAFEPTTTVCRLAAGVCDIVETCTGTDALCPADALESNSTVCRVSTAICDPSELCDGINADCPADVLEDALCDDADICTTDTCVSGTGCVFTPIPGCASTVPTCYIDSTIGTDTNDCTQSTQGAGTVGPCNTFSRVFTLGCDYIIAADGDYDDAGDRGLTLSGDYCPHIQRLTPNGAFGVIVNLEQMDRFVSITGSAVATGTFRAEGVRFLRGKETGNHGGVIFATGGCNVEVVDCIFEDSEARFNGGAIYMQASGFTGAINLTVTDSLFTGNKALGTSGGAIFVGGNANAFGNVVVNIDPTIFEDNTAALVGGALAVTSGAVVNIDDTIFRRNSVTRASNVVATPVGGGVFVGTGSRVHVTNSSFYDNAVSGDFNDGGAIAVDSTSLLIAASSFFCSNVASGVNSQGGAIYSVVREQVIFDPSETLFQCNSAGVTVDDHVAPTGSCLSTPFCVIQTAGSPCDACEGGVVPSNLFAPSECWISNGEFGNPVGNDANVGSALLPLATFSQAFINNCKVIHVYGGTYTGVLNREFQISYGVYIDEVGNGDAVVNLASLGRFLQIDPNLQETTIVDITIINGLKDGEVGGAVYVQGNTLGVRPIFSTWGANFTRNVVTGSMNNGGAVALVDARANISHSAFECNVASFCGGALFVFDNEQEVKDPDVLQMIDNSTFIFNEAWHGGAIRFINQEKIRVQYNDFEHNVALGASDSSGGAIRLDNNWQTEILHNTFSGNVAERRGGGVHHQTAATLVSYVKFVNDTFCNNVASNGIIGNGGGYAVLPGGGTELQEFQAPDSHFQCNVDATPPGYTDPTSVCTTDPECVVVAAADSDSDGVCDRCDNKPANDCGHSIAILIPFQAVVGALEGAELVNVIKDHFRSPDFVNSTVTIIIYGNNDARVLATYTHLEDDACVRGLCWLLENLDWDNAPAGLNNWVAPFELLLDISLTAGVPDQVMFFSHDRPNSIGGGVVSTGVARAAAVTASQALQLHGSRVLGIDFGVSSIDMPFISGPSLLAAYLEGIDAGNNCPDAIEHYDWFNVDSFFDIYTELHNIHQQVCCPSKMDVCGICNGDGSLCSGCGLCNLMTQDICTGADNNTCVVETCTTNATYPNGLCGTSPVSAGIMCNTDDCFVGQECDGAGTCAGGIPAEFVPTGMGGCYRSPCEISTCTGPTLNCTYIDKMDALNSVCLPGYNASDPNHDPTYWCGCDNGLACDTVTCDPTPLSDPAGVYPMGSQAIGMLSQGRCRAPVPTIFPGPLTAGDSCDAGGAVFNTTLAASRCVMGTYVCNDTTDSLVCISAIGPLAMEDCGIDGTGNGIDDNCNGVVDEGCDGTTCVTAVDCDPFKPTVCSISRCNVNNECRYDGGAATLGIACDDGMVCTSNDTCDGTGGSNMPSMCVGVLDCPQDDNVCTFPPRCDGMGECLEPNRGNGARPTGCNDFGDANRPDDLCLVYCTCQNPNMNVSQCECMNKVDVAATAVPVAGCDDGNPCTLDFCNSTDGSCYYENIPTGTSCPDIVPQDACFVAECVVPNIGTAKDPVNGTSTCQMINLATIPFTEGGCDDLNVCTADWCVFNHTGNGQAVCKHEFEQWLDEPCNDQNECTVDDKCTLEGNAQIGFSSWCKGTDTSQTMCDDNNQCTITTCDPVLGCQTDVDTLNGTACEYSMNPCDGGICLWGHCVATPTTCNGLLPCQIGSCDALTGECTYVDNVGAPCDDGDECTYLDQCQMGGTCLGTSPNCDDNNPCTDDSCNATTGQCQNVPNTASACTDNNPCTIDACETDGSCSHTPVACQQDSNPCTESICIPLPGGGTDCVTMNVDGIACDDSNLCTDNDQCWNGECHGIEKHCDDGWFCNGEEICNPANGRCISGAVPVCDDGDPCTVDMCSNDAHDCVHTPNPEIGEVCGISNIFPCSLGWKVCNATTGEITCHGNRDPGAEICDQVDNNCDGVIDEGCGVTCLNNADCDSLDNLPCWDAYCDIDTNECRVEATHNSCNDGNACTDNDQCLWGVCEGTPTRDCVNPDPCVTGRCEDQGGQKVCIDEIVEGRSCNDGSLCTVFDQCDAAGECVGTPRSCDDGNFCTADSCDELTGDCVHTVLTGRACNDGLLCTSMDQCQADGSCRGEPVECMPTGDPCVVAVCDPILGCTTEHAPYDTPCEPADLCEVWGKCHYGVCVGIPKECTSDTPCIDRTCNSATGECEASYTNATCSDGNPCTTQDQCNAQTGLCTGVTTQCQVTNPVCQVAYCDADSGDCVVVNVDNQCDDGDPCTEHDYCREGECVGKPKQCDDGLFCNGQEACVAGQCITIGGTAPDCQAQAGLCAIGICNDSTAQCDISPLPYIGQLCGSSNIGKCQYGTYICDPQTGQSTCVGNVEPDPNDACGTHNTGNGIDENCNGVVDEGCGSHCVVNSDCWPLGCYDEVCTVDNTCLYIPNQDPCQTNRPCKLPGVCHYGTCKEEDLNCSTANPCTDGYCDQNTGMCVEYNTDGVSCDDGDACTYNDKCSTGTCSGMMEVCDDNNPCTADTCDPATGQCNFRRTSQACDDGNACTVGDRCDASTGLCVPGALESCDDQNECTEDIQVSVNNQCQCIHVPVAVPTACLIDDPCIEHGWCAYGHCEGLPKNCTDGNPCTRDYCDEITGQCVNERTTDRCDDGNPCTINDRCYLSTGTCFGEELDCSTGNPCVTGFCNVDSGECEAINNSNPCDDSDACTLEDVCVEGECRGFEAIDCDDGWYCNGAETCHSGECLPGVEVSCSDDDDDRCTVPLCSNDYHACIQVLNPTVGNQCGITDVGPCQYGEIVCNPLNGDLTCSGNVDPATEVCDNIDNNCNGVVDEGCGVTCVITGDCPALACYDVVCSVENVCIYTPNHDPCNDGLVCTENDQCHAGTCMGTPVSVDDGNPCTTDFCNEMMGGVQHVNVGAGLGSCDDHNACTVHDVCDGAGGCAGTPKSCDDGNPCTDDSCDLYGNCVHTPAAGRSCSDYNACTENDQCNHYGQCEGTPVVCDDQNECTEDYCDRYLQQCVFSALTGDACSDGNPCTLNDECVAGTCVAGETLECVSENQCEAGVCNSSIGECEFTATPGARCDDGNPCTMMDECNAQAECSGTPKVCRDGNVCTTGVCSSQTGECLFIDNSDDCTDGDLCTTCRCNDGGCECEPIDCSDGLFCNGEETCDEGQCVQGTPPNCDDMNVCTIDFCNNTAAECQHVYVPELGQPCGITDVGECRFGVYSCEPHSGLICLGNVDPAPLEACNGRDDNCNGVVDEGCGVTCVVNSDCDGVAPNECFDAFCSNENLCVLVPNEDPCVQDDGDLCVLTRRCYHGMCAVESVVECQDDGNQCTREYCDSADGECKRENKNGDACDDHNKCTINDYCDVWLGQCVGTPKNCADAFQCTDDSCDQNTGECVHTRRSGMCDDGNACTVNDQCDDESCCVGEPFDCDDQDPCTEDICIVGPLGQPRCIHVPGNDGHTCDDGDLCTVHDTCHHGKCMGSAKDCDDNNECTTDVCDLRTGACLHRDNTLMCDDGNPCTEMDQCSQGECVGVPKDCAVYDVCKTGFCNATAGGECQFVFNSSPCDDYDACTKDDKCWQGHCKGTPLQCSDGLFCNGEEYCDPLAGECVDGPPPICNDDNVCTINRCNDTSGQCEFDPLPQIGTKCGYNDTGVCQSGRYECDRFRGLSCVGSVGPQPEDCGHYGTGNGLDEDCNGVADDGCGTFCVRDEQCPPKYCKEAVCAKNMTCIYLPIVGHGCIPPTPECKNGWLVVSDGGHTHPYGHGYYEKQCLCAPGFAGANCTECGDPADPHYAYVCHKSCGDYDDDDDAYHNCIYKLTITERDELHHLLTAYDDDKFVLPGHEGLDCRCNPYGTELDVQMVVKDHELNKIHVENGHYVALPGPGHSGYGDKQGLWWLPLVAVIVLVVIILAVVVGHWALGGTDERTNSHETTALLVSDHSRGRDVAVVRTTHQAHHPGQQLHQRRPVDSGVAVSHTDISLDLTPVTPSSKQQ